MAALVTIVLVAVSLASAAAAWADASLQPPSSSPDPTFGRPISFSITGATPGPNPNPGYTEYQALLAVRPSSGPACGPYDYDDFSFESTDLVHQVWDVSSADGPFTETFAESPTYSGSPDSIEPGTYLACDWLWNVQQDDFAGTHGLIAMEQGTITVREPRFSMSLRLHGHLTIQHYPPPSGKNLHYTTLTARISAEVGEGRELLVTVMPPRTTTCPQNVPKSLYYRREAIFFDGHLNGEAGVNLRNGGPFTYKMGVAVTYGGAKPGRSLLCAGIYDDNDTSAPAHEEAVAHTWVKVKR